MKKTLSVFSFIYTFPDLWDSALPAVPLPSNPVCCSGERRKLMSHGWNVESGFMDQRSGWGGVGVGGGYAQRSEVRISINKRENT